MVLAVFLGISLFLPSTWAQEAQSSLSSQVIQDVANSAIDTYKKHGADIAFNAINNKTLNQGEVFPIVYEARKEGVFVAFGQDPSLVRQRINGVQDSIHKNHVLLDSLKLFKTSGAWLTYYWAPPHLSGSFLVYFWGLPLDNYIMGAALLTSRENLNVHLEWEKAVKDLVTSVINKYVQIRENVFHEINWGFFTKGSLYPFVVEARMEGMIKAHGADYSLVNKKNKNLQDSDGRQIILEMVRMATRNGTWLTYRWVNPESKEIELKRSWIVRYKNYVFGSGFYFP